MKVSVLCPIHRYGGLDVTFFGLEHQAFPSKEDYELILCDKLYNLRKDIVKEWSEINGINVIHFRPSNRSEYHVHSSILNECLSKASGECCIVMGDYSCAEPYWLERHYKHYLHEVCCSAPQVIHGLPKLKDHLVQPYSVFAEPFSMDMFKLAPVFSMDMKSRLPAIEIDHTYWYNRNESFSREKAISIGGWDESYDNTVGPSNKEFGLRLKYEAGCKIVNDPFNWIRRIMSYPIPPFTTFNDPETDDSKNMKKYKELCKKYGAPE